MRLQKITAQPGFKTPLHLHPQPGIVYVVRGTLTCETSMDVHATYIQAVTGIVTPKKTILTG